MSIFREHKTTADRSASDRSRHKRKIEKAIRANGFINENTADRN